MRLHRLEVTAFGPFADTITVNFDDLSTAGLFLLAGPTGSGKTSILDAVCFALYGDVPGHRALARRLRSDHAPAGRAPSVVLDCTLGGRRLRVERSPQWSRPKRRGTGTTQEPAHVVVTEQVGSQWRAVTTRLDEAGHLLGELLGMNLAQFTQVAMLPQGAFQAFLRARADDRQKLLEKLFRTERFRQVEGWLAERRRQLHREANDRRGEIDKLVSRVEEALEAAAPTRHDEEAGSAEAVRAWLDDLARSLADQVESVRRQVAEREALVTRAAALSAEGKSVARAQQRRWEAEDRLRALTADAAAMDDRRARLAAARRAQPVVALLQLTDEASAEAARLRAAADRACERAAEHLPTGATDLQQALHEAERTASTARSLLPDEEELDELQSAGAEAAAQREETGRRIRQLEAEVRQALPDAVRQADEALVRGREAAARQPAAQVAVTTLETRLGAARRVLALAVDLADAQEEVRTRHAEALRLKEELLAVRERRLQGMAAEIAGGLAVGGECPVCGSCDHPHPAVRSTGAPDAQAEKEAQRIHADADVAHVAARDRAHGLSTLLAAARSEAGGGAVEDLEPALTEALEHRQRLADAAAEVAASEAAHQQALAALEAARAELERLRSARSAAEAAATHRAERIRSVRSRLDALLDGSRAATLAELIDLAGRTAAACAAALEAAAAASRAEAEAEQRATRLAHACTDAGFPDPGALRDAALPSEEVDRLDGAIRRHDDSVTAVCAQLEDPDLAAARLLPEPDLEALAADEESARAELSAAERSLAAATHRRTRLTALSGELEGAFAAFEPVQDELALVTSVASFAEGKSADNRLSMRLSAYALSFRLRQVVDAANERLDRMSDQRYTLEHSEGHGAGDRRGGLALLVRDAWSGQARDPATLSGGETFLVSLALALGLSDVVTHEAAGAELGTLFVDEGFGSLDPETLDAVLDSLDALRSGGRVVGIVSHVAEVRNRIATRLVVTKTPSGSTVRQVVGQA